MFVGKKKIQLYAQVFLLSAFTPVLCANAVELQPRDQTHQDALEKTIQSTNFKTIPAGTPLTKEAIAQISSTAAAQTIGAMRTKPSLTNRPPAAIDPTDAHGGSFIQLPGGGDLEAVIGQGATPSPETVAFVRQILDHLLNTREKLKIIETPEDPWKPLLDYGKAADKDKAAIEAFSGKNREKIQAIMEAIKTAELPKAPVPGGVAKPKIGTGGGKG